MNSKQKKRNKEIHTRYITVKLMKTDNDETRSREILEYKRERKKRKRLKTRPLRDKKVLLVLKH